MKAKNILWIGAIGVALYYILNKKNKNSARVSPDEGDLDLQDVMNGDEPTSLKPVDPKPTISLEKKISLFKEGNKYYRGGARPSESLLQRMKADREKALQKIKSMGLMAEFIQWQNKEKSKLNVFLPPFANPQKDILLKEGRPMFTTYAVNTTPNSGIRPLIPSVNRR